MPRLLLSSLLILAPALANAQPTEGAAAPPAEAVPQDGAELVAPTVDDAPPAPDQADELGTTAPDAAVAPDPNSPREEANKPYYFVGARFRLLWIPSFMVGLFADVEDWSGAINPAAGLEFTYRKNSFDVIGALWWAGASADPGFMKGQSDPDTSFEEIKSSLNLWILSADFVWSYDFNEVVSFTYGAGIGIGLVTGSLMRNEAYRKGGEWTPCPYAGFDGGGPDFCEAEGGQYDVNEADGGDVPPVVPWISLPHLGLRIKPHRNFMMRIDMGFGIGFFLGVSGNYGI
ncbi:MAG: hypothetical protein HYY06_10960 [Deltaproteobacteria bacterium]|nr:hypothetical protein [Deltaproteobacteria bacterium]